MTNKPRLYVPDYLAYADPFKQMFDVVHESGKPYQKDTLLSCDFLMLTGGEDIEPAYYEHEAIPQCQHESNNERDSDEWLLAQAAISADIPIIGICRGAQWLSVLGGGKLIQHVTGHDHGYHPIQTIDSNNATIPMSSAHHQMCDLRGVEHLLIAWSEKLSRMYLSEKQVNLYPKGLTHEPEVFYIPSIRGFGIQGHPEYMHNDHITNHFLRQQLRTVYNLEQELVR